MQFSQYHCNPSNSPSFLFASITKPIDPSERLGEWGTFGGRRKISPSLINTCYSLVSSEEGISVSAVYNYNQEENKIKSIPGAKGLSPNSSAIIKDNAWDWATNIWADMLG